MIKIPSVRPSVFPNSVVAESGVRLAGWWPISHPTGAAVVNQLTGSASAITAATWKPDTIGTCLDFSGTNQYVNLGQTTLSGSATLSIWLNADAFNYPGNAFSVAGVFGRGAWGADGNGDFRIICYHFGGITYLQGSVRTSAGDYTAAVNAATLSTEVWYHVALVYNESATSLVFYINGVAAASASTAGTMADAAKNFLLGAYPANESNTEFNGRLADARIYSGALSSAQVRSLAMPETRWKDFWYQSPLFVPEIPIISTSTTSQLGLAQLGLLQLGMIDSGAGPTPPVVGPPEMSTWFMNTEQPIIPFLEVISY